MMVGASVRSPMSGFDLLAGLPLIHSHASPWDSALRMMACSSLIVPPASPFSSSSPKYVSRSWAVGFASFLLPSAGRMGLDVHGVGLDGGAGSALPDDVLHRLVEQLGEGRRHADVLAFADLVDEPVEGLDRVALASTEDWETWRGLPVSGSLPM